MSNIKTLIDTNNSAFRASSLSKPHKTLVSLLSSYADLIIQQINLEQRILDSIRDWSATHNGLLSLMGGFNVPFNDRKNKLEGFKTGLSAKLITCQSNFDCLIDKLSIFVTSQSKTAKKIDYYEGKIEKIIQSNKRKVTLGRKLSENECDIMDRNERKLENYKVKLCNEERQIDQLERQVTEEQLQSIVPAISSFLEFVIGDNYQDAFTSHIRAKSNSRDAIFNLTSLTIHKDN